jgi:chromosome partitioning protein
MAKVIAVANQKGGCGKTSVTANLGIGLAMAGEKVLLIDADPQGSLTVSLGYPDPDNIHQTLATIMMGIINEEEFPKEYAMLHHEEDVDIVPANMELSGLEVSLSNAMSREMILKEYIDSVRDEYSYILIDCMPSLGIMTINALVAADSVIIPVLCETFCYAHHSSGPGMFICLNPKNDTHNVYLNPQSFASSSSSSQSGSSISLSSSFFSIAFRN